MDGGERNAPPPTRQEQGCPLNYLSLRFRSKEGDERREERERKEEKKYNKLNSIIDFMGGAFFGSFCYRRDWIRRIERGAQRSATPPISKLLYISYIQIHVYITFMINER